MAGRWKGRWTGWGVDRESLGSRYWSSSFPSSPSLHRESRKVLRKRKSTLWMPKPRREMLMPLTSNAGRSKRRR